MDQNDVERWVNEYRDLPDAELHLLTRRHDHRYAEHFAALKLLESRRSERDSLRQKIDRRRYQTILWIAALTLLATIAGVALTAWQAFR